MVDNFYNSQQWRELKRKAFKRYGRKCQATGLTEKDGIVLSVDHIKPRSKRPDLALKLSNVQILELGLNKTKGARIVKDWRPLKWRVYYGFLLFVKRLVYALLTIGLSVILILCIWYEYDRVSFASFLAQIPIATFSDHILKYYE